MSKKIFSIILYISLLCVISINAKEVKICDDIGEWPPFSYFERDSEGNVTPQLTGAVTELLEEVFKIVDVKHSISMLPWKRCLMSVANFDRIQKYEIFINGIRSPEREEKYLISKPIYKTHQGVFYSSIKYPQGLPLYKASDINKFRICSIYGYDIDFNNELYDFNKDTKVDDGAKDSLAALKKISLGRCDILINSKEPIYGSVKIGKFQLPKDIKSMNMPEIKPTEFYIFIAKKSPRGNILLKEINKAIEILQNNGISTKIFNKYLSQD